MTSTRVNELDLLRFVAAFAVVIFHYAFRGYAADAMSLMPYPALAPVAKYGYLGIELLFMISGFVISMTATSRPLLSFVQSRIVRLYPTFWICCTITFAVTLAIGEPRYVATVGEYLANMTLVSGFFGVPLLDGAYWFLYVELIFYGLVTAALFIGGVRRYQAFLAMWLLAEIALEVLPVGRHPARLLADYSVCFIAGAELFLIWSRGISLVRVAALAACFGVALLQATNRLPAFEANYSTGMNDGVVVGVVTASFFVMLLISLRRTGALAHTRWVVAGAISYPLYLLHQHIGFMVFNALYPSVNSHVLFGGTLAVMLGAAYAVHVLVEKRLTTPMHAAVHTLADRLWPR